MSKAYKTKPQRVLNSKEHTQLRGGVGSLRWIVDHCCPQLSFQLAELRRTQASPTVQDLLKHKKVIRAAKVIESKIKIRSIPVAHASITNCFFPVVVLSWQTKKIKRVVRSSLAAETCSMSTCQEHLDWMRTMWRQIPLVNLCLRITNSFSRHVPVFLAPTAKVFTTQHTRKEQLRRQQTRDLQVSWP